MYALKYIFINFTFVSICWYHERFQYHILDFVKSFCGDKNIQKIKDNLGACVGENLPILKSEVEHTIRSLKKGKSTGIYNIPSEIIINGGSKMVIIMTLLCQKIVVKKEWHYEWVQSLIIPIPKKGDPRKFNNYKTISLISHPSKIMLRIILNRLNPIA